MKAVKFYYHVILWVGLFLALNVIFRQVFFLDEELATLFSFLVLILGVFLDLRRSMR